jgi:CBS-domain-containing membrane protein
MAVKKTSVKDVMTTNVVAVREEATFKEMVAALHSFRISAFPVLDATERVIGVVSAADLLAKEAGPALGRLAWHPKERAKATGVTAADVMTAPAVTITENASAGEAAALMRSRRVKRLPVVDRDGRIRGIVSRVDVLTVYERPDREIWDEVVKGVLVSEFGLDPELFMVTVRSGVVTITGSIEKRADALGVLNAIRHLEGVVALRDRLSYPAA